jgi:signal peptidase I
VLVAVLLLQTWYLEGLLVPMKVTSGSMAPGLLGPHQELVCDDCGARFAIGTDARPNLYAVCPNCGYAENRPSNLPELGGDWTLVSRPVFQLRPPQRWEVVAFRNPERAGRIAVKRVVGLPGEAVEIRDGEVYVNETIQRKPFAQQKAMAVLVYDANHAPKLETLPPRWRGDLPNSQWSWTDGRLTRPATPDQKAVDWLSYAHWNRLPGQPGKVQRGPITNTSSYNQAFPQRSEIVRPVSDLLLSFRLMKTSGAGKLLVKLTDGRELIRVELDPEQERLEVFHNDQRLEGTSGEDVARCAAGCQIDVALIDCQFTLALDGRIVRQWSYEPGRDPPPPTLRPVAIGARRLGVEICDLRLYRDVYYTRPIGRDARWGVDHPCHLGTGQYFVLGDNSAISLDSRTWPQGPAVPEELLVGKPFLVDFATQRVGWGRGSFLIPDLTRIRYIR